MIVQVCATAVMRGGRSAQLEMCAHDDAAFHSPDDGRACALAGGGIISRIARAGLPQGALDAGVLETLPGKQPLIKRAYRPPNYETPVAYFNDVITPNDRFFVRWHLANIPANDASAWRLSVSGGGAAQPFELTFE